MAGLPLSLLLAVGVRPNIVSRIPLVEGGLGLAVAVPAGLVAGARGFVVGLALAAVGGVLQMILILAKHLPRTGSSRASV